MRGGWAFIDSKRGGGYPKSRGRGIGAKSVFVGKSGEACLFFGGFGGRKVQPSF